MEINQDIVKLIQSYHHNPLLWVRDYFGDSITLTRQQTEAMKELGKLISAKLKVAKGEKLTKSELTYSKKKGLSIQSGVGTGKDFLASLISWYFLFCFGPNCKVPVTANTDKQLKNVFMSEMSKVARLCRKNEEGVSIFESQFEIQSEKIYAKQFKGKEWFLEAVTINTKNSEEEQAVALGGRHADFMLIVVDEASGIPEPVFRPLDATTTGILNIILIIFNPTRAKGYAIDTQTRDREHWVALRWNAEESELVKKEQIQYMADKYGVNSNPYRIRVLGMPPTSDEDTLIPWDWLEDAVDRQIEPLDDDPVIKGMDCGAGGDKSVIVTRKGDYVIKIERNHSPESMIVTGWGKDSIDNDEARAMLVDVIGIGHGIYGRLREVVKGFTRVLPVDSRAKAFNEMKFQNRRAEMYWNLRERFEGRTIRIPRDNDLQDQLGAMKYTVVDSNGKIAINKKSDVKKTVGHSPDESDALALTYAFPESMFRKSKAQIDPWDTDSDELENRTTWMAA